MVVGNEDRPLSRMMAKQIVGGQLLSGVNGLLIFCSGRFEMIMDMLQVDEAVLSECGHLLSVAIVESAVATDRWY